MDNQPMDEISLRDLIESLLRGKYIIIGVTILAILISGIVSFVFLPQQYEAKTVLMANPINLDSAKLGSSGNELVEYLIKLPTMTVETYLQQIVASEVLSETIEELNLRTDAGQLIRPGTLRTMITVERIKDTNLLELAVKHSDATTAARIADSVAENFIDYISKNTRLLGQQAVSLIEKQLEAEEENLRQKSLALANYWKENDNIEVLKGKVTALKEQLIQANDKLLVLERQIAANKKSLAVLATLVGDTSFDLDDFWVTTGTETKPEQTDPDLEINIGLGGNNLDKALLEVRLAQLQTDLIVDINKRDALEAQLATIESDLTAAQTQLTEDEYRFNALNRDMEMAKQAYDAYQQKYKEATLAAASEIGKSSVIITSHAQMPQSASSPNKKLNLAIGTVLGLMLGIFIALFIDYWRRSQPVKDVKKTADSKA